MEFSDSQKIQSDSQGFHSVFERKFKGISVERLPVGLAIILVGFTRIPVGFTSISLGFARNSVRL